MNTIIRFAEADATAAQPLFVDPETGLSCAVTAREGPLAIDLVASDYRVLVMQRGRAIIETSDAGRTEIEAGQAITLPIGAHYRWIQEADTVVYETRLGAPVARPGDGAIVPVRPAELAEEMRPSAAPKAELLIGPTPEQAVRRCFADPTGQWTVGVWRSTPYHRMTMPFPKHEMMYLLSGSLSLTVPGAEPEIFHAGDTLLIPRGTVCDWKTDGMSKIYCIFETRPPA